VACIRKTVRPGIRFAWPIGAHENVQQVVSVRF
jgi:hypothetical protein